MVQAGGRYPPIHKAWNNLISPHRTHLCRICRRIQTGNPTLNAFVASPAREERVLVTFARAKVTSRPSQRVTSHRNEKYYTTP